MTIRNIPGTQFFSGQGVVSRANLLNGVPTGFVPFGNICAMTLGIEQEQETEKECMSGQRSVALRLITETDITIEMEVSNSSAANLAYSTLGDYNVVPLGNAVTKTFRAFGANRTYSLDVIGATVTSVQNLTQAAALDVNVDYTVNDEVGSINLLDDGTGAIVFDEDPTLADEIEVTYNFVAHTVVDALTQGSSDSWLRIEGLNTANSLRPVVIDIFRFRNSALSEWSIIGDEVSHLPITGNALLEPSRAVGSKFFHVRMLDIDQSIAA